MGPILTLTTDFGLTDHYVGTMKGVILSRCPDARIFDICHAVPPFSIWPGAYTIDQAAPFFPAGTTHIVVIDPGVGTSRRAVLVEAIGQRFIAPDNGVLTMVLAREPKAVAREIANRDLFLPALSSTFHGRDLFAPVAASLAAGAARPEETGPLISDLQLLPELEPEEVSPGHWNGFILSIDHFGNIITNFKAARYDISRVSLRIGGRPIVTFHSTFGLSAHAGERFFYSGSSGFIELAVSRQSAAAQLGAACGDRIELEIV